jgi:SAM-dependent methyltransferase
MINNKCRLCGHVNFHKYLDLGFTPPADQFRRSEQLVYAEETYPLEVQMCESCGLSQLSFTVSPEVLYRNDYPYESSITKTGDLHWTQFANSIIAKFGLSNNDLVVDVGSNVGTLLNKFKIQGINVQGVDPAANIVMIAQANGIDTLCEFFNGESVQKIISSKSRAKIITATNCFAHVDDLNIFMKNIFQLLEDDGVFIFESPHIKNLIKKNEYDTIYHEHLSYLSLKPLVKFAEKFDLQIFDVVESDIHGGSFRVFFCKKGKYPIEDNVHKMIKLEEDEGIFDVKVLDQFALRVKDNKAQLMEMLYSLKKQGKSVVGVSAPAKGMTLLNYCGIDREILDYVTEKSQLKIGRYTPGGHIPVYSDERLIQDQPDYALLLAWNFADEIIKNLDEYRKKGGRFIIPIPNPKIL